MFKLYIPKLKDKIRLVSDIVFKADDAQNGYGVPVNSWAFKEIMDPNSEVLAWNWCRNNPDIRLEEGTVLQFKRYFISAQAKSDSVKVFIFAHPERRLTPKRNGGTAAQQIELELPVDILNRMYYEPVTI